MSSTPTLPTRPKNAHKGLCGRIAIIAGSHKLLGAAILTANAALKSGAGYVHLFTVSEAVPEIPTQYPELIVHTLAKDDGFLGKDHVKFLDTEIKRLQINSIAIGPGLGTNTETTSLINTLLESTIIPKKIPCVIDADGLNGILDKHWSKLEKNQCVLTPHPGEFKTLFPSLGLDNNSEKDRQEKAVLASKKTKQVVVLKGHHTIIATTSSTVINKTGNPGLASAGTGDVLTGLIASLIGQGLSTNDAAQLGCYIHGLAADNLFKTHHYGFSASDLIAEIPNCLKIVETDQPDVQ